MNFIGNDIIDLLHPPNIGVEKNLRYHKKFLSESETQLLPELNQSFVWLLWSIKETAYKSFIKQGAPVGFYPKKILISSLKYEKGKHLATVEYEGLKTQTTSVISKEHIHTKTFSKSTTQNSKIIIRPPEEVSAYLRQELTTSIAKELDVLPGYVSISKSKENVPLVTVKHSNVAIDVSFSHDNVWGAYVYQVWFTG